MYTLKIENKSGDQLELTHNESDFQVLSVTGLNPPKSTINTSTVAGLDGAKFNSSSLNTRNIVMNIKLNGDVEQNRLLFYKYFVTKEKCKVYYTNNSLDVYIEGYVESVECNLFTKSETVQISIICTSPYFKAAQAMVTDLSRNSKLFAFPFSINVGDPICFSESGNSGIKNVFNNTANETGIIIDIEFLKSASTLKIIDVTYGEQFIVNYNFVEGDKLLINTNKGEKSITLTRNTEVINLFPYVDISQGSKFFLLRTGDNVFTYSVNDGDDNDAIYIKIKFNEIYRGV